MFPIEFGANVPVSNNVSRDISKLIKRYRIISRGIRNLWGKMKVNFLVNCVNDRYIRNTCAVHVSPITHNRSQT